MPIPRMGGISGQNMRTNHLNRQSVVTRHKRVNEGPNRELLIRMADQKFAKGDIIEFKIKSRQKPEDQQETEE